MKSNIRYKNLSLFSFTFLCFISFSINAQWSEIDKVSASDGAASDFLGYSVSISGDYILVGAFEEDGSGIDQGAAYIYENDGAGNWTNERKIVPGDVADQDNFGIAVALSGDYAVIGSYKDDDGDTDTGSAYIYKNDGSNNWNFVTKLNASDATAGDDFGQTVAIDGNYVVVGSRNNGGNGAAYVFKNNGSDVYSEIAKLIASDAASGDEFGTSVGISGNNIVIGAPKDDSELGAIYIFKNNGSDVYTEVTKQISSDGASSDLFGFSVSIDGDYVVAGAYQNGDAGVNSGSAYIFKNDGSDSWSELKKITASDAAANNYFGYAVSISGDYAIVSSYGSNSFRGGVYAFKNNGSDNWDELLKMSASDGVSNDLLGFSVAVSNETAVFGAIGDGGGNIGSAYIFKENNAWTGAINGNWNDPANWSEGSVPTSSDDIFITATSVQNLNISTGAEANDLFVESGVTMAITSNYLSVAGDLINNGSITVSSGSSLVVSGARTGTGTETINRNLRAGRIQSMVGVPLENATFADLGATDIYQWNTAAQSFSVISSSDGTIIEAGRGYFVNGTSPSLTGRINSGNVDVSVVLAGDNFNLIANPYAAALDASLFFAANNPIIAGGQAYIWNDGGQNVGVIRNGDFLIVNSAGEAGSALPTNNGTPVAGSKAGTDWNNSFNSYQGFYIEATSSGNISFTPSMQINSDNEDLASFRVATTEQSNIRLKLSGDEIANDILIAMRDDATLGEDYSLDAKKRSGNEFISFYSLIDDNEYAIQSIPHASITDMSVNLGFKLTEPGSYSIEVTSFENINNELSIYLINNLTNEHHALSEGTVIPFTIDEGNTFNSMYSIYISESDLITALEDNISDIKVYCSNNDIHIESKILNGFQEVQIITLAGKSVFEERVNFIHGKGIMRTQIENNGIYILRVVNESIKFIKR